MLGIKLDLRKCFDSVSIEMAIGCAEKLGMPEGVTTALRHVYKDLRRVFTNEGMVDDRWIKASTGLLQGCPFSPILLGIVMAAYVQHLQGSLQELLRAKDATGRVNLFVDDRIAWVVAKDPATACEIIKAIDEMTRDFDKAAGFDRHPLKGQLFTNSKAAATLARKTLSHIGPTVFVSEILGITYTFRGKWKARHAPEKFCVALERLRRIPKGTRTRHRRIKAVNCLVMPIIKWGGAWTTPKKTVIAKLRTAIERAVLGTVVVGRSRLVNGACRLGASLDPQHQLDREAFELEAYRVRELEKGTLETDLDETMGSRWLEVAGRWNWKQISPGEFQTPDGILQLGWEGRRTLQRLM